jgi:micrococcal nuclease
MFLAILLAAALSVVDGDTVRMDGVTYRLLGFDTPETVYAQCSYERRLGYEATKRLEELIRNATTVELEKTNRSCKWFRLCARLVIDGDVLAVTMIREGHAVPYDGNTKRRDWCASPT